MVELKKGARITGGDRSRLAADLKRKYSSGSSIRELAAETGRSYGFVHRILGRLTSTDEQAARLRSTVHALLSTGSVEAAAQRLCVHKNTVRYRIERAEELMGRRVADSSTEIEVALRCHLTFFTS